MEIMLVKLAMFLSPFTKLLLIRKFLEENKDGYANIFFILKDVKFSLNGPEYSLIYGAATLSQMDATSNISKRALLNFR